MWIMKLLGENGVIAQLIGLLTVTFIVLKLTRVIDWPWVWVLSPMILAVVVTLLMAIIWTASRE